MAPNCYVSSKEKVEITCNEGHIWKTNPSVINNGSWCPECGERTQTAGATKYYEILRKRGALAADPYIDSKTSVRIQCNLGHIWNTTPSSINTDAHWCPVCADRSPIAAAESYCRVVSERGGIPIDVLYVQIDHQ